MALRESRWDKLIRYAALGALASLLVGSIALSEVRWGQATIDGFGRSLLTGALTLITALMLALAVLRPNRRETFWFGLYATASGLRPWVDAAPWRSLVHSGAVRMAVGQGLEALATLAALGFLAHIAGRPDSRALRLGRWATGAALVLGVVSPWIPGAPRHDDIRVVVALIGLGCAVVLARQGWVARARLIGPLVVMGGLLALATLADFLLEGRDPMVATAVFASRFSFLIVTTLVLVLRHSEASEWYTGLAEHARDALLVVDPAGVVLTANPASDALVGGQAQARDLSALVVGEDRELLRAHLRGEEQGRRAVLRVQGADELVVESVAVNLPESRILLAMRDITLRRQVEARLVHAARMETAGILASGIAHDVNNALSALMAHIEMLRLRADDAAKVRLDRMEAVIRRSAVMTRRLLTTVRGGASARVPVRVIEPVQSAVELVRTMLPSDLQVEVSSAEGLPRVLGSADELEQAVLNLLLNARDAMAGRAGTLRVRLLPIAEGAHVGGVNLSVEDEGPGVPAHLRARIWEPFYTTKEPGRGTGLGLSVVARVARDHGGSVEIKDGEGGLGARFELLLPGAGTASLPAGAGPTLTRVLLVDDDPDIRELMRAELLARSCKVYVAQSAEEALRLYDEVGGPIDLLITDMVLPGASGAELARTLVARDERLPVLVVSGFVPEAEKNLDPRWHRLIKPFNTERFAAAVRGTLIGAAMGRDD